MKEIFAYILEYMLTIYKCQKFQFSINLGGCHCVVVLEQDTFILA